LPRDGSHLANAARVERVYQRKEMGWRQKVDEANIRERFGAAMAARGQAWREVRGGLAKEFRDGCDAFFVTASAWPRLIADISGVEEPEQAITALADELQRLDERRWQVLCGLRHYAVEVKAALDRSADGIWNVQAADGCASSLSVGPALTRMVRKFEAAEALRRLLKGSLLRPPSPKRAGRLVSLAELPVQEIPYRDEVESPIAVDTMGLLGVDCTTLQEKSFQPASRQELTDVLTRYRDTPGMAVVQGLRERLGGERFFIDLCRPQVANLDFSDGRDAFRIAPRGRRVARWIEKYGVEGTIEWLAREYARLDKARAELLRGVKTLMASRGYALDERTLDRTWWFGTTRREARFDPGRPLTASLKKQMPLEALREWLEETRPFVIPSDEELEAAFREPIQEPVCRNLPQRDPAHGPRLPELSELDLSDLDRQAADLIAKIRQCGARPVHGRSVFGQDLLSCWSQPRWYVRGGDTWVDEAWWVQLAKWCWGNSRDPRAASILMLNGDDRPRESLLGEYRELGEYNHEYCDDVAAWILREDLGWPVDEMPDCPDVLGSPPPEEARPAALRIRQQIEQSGQQNADEERSESTLLDALKNLAALDAVSAVEWLTDAEIEQLHQRCMRWAGATEDFFELREEEPLAAAARFGWTDVLDVLAGNPVLATVFLAEEFGRLALGKAAQRLSLIASGPLAARFAAAALRLDPVAEAEAAAKAALSDDPGLASYVDGLRESQEKWYRVVQLEGAVAWTRCRAARSDHSRHG